VKRVPMRKIDVHTHILPKTWPEMEHIGLRMRPLEEERDGPLLDFTHAMEWSDGSLFRKVKPNCLCCDARLVECDEHGVDVQVLSPVPVMFNYDIPPPIAERWCRYLNDDMAAQVAKNPRRLVGLGTLPMQDATMAVAELRRCVTELGFAGVEIGSHINAWQEDGEVKKVMLSDPCLLPVFEEAAALGACIFVHPWDMDWCDSNYWLPWLVGMPAETSLAICSVMMGGVLDKLPTLKIMFAHGGGAFPGTLARIDWGYKTRPDLVAKDSSRYPSQMTKQIYVDSLTHDMAVLNNLIELFGPERIALGSDYPFPLGEMPSVAPVTGEEITVYPGHMIEECDLDADTKNQILHRTALEFLGRKESDFDWKDLEQ